MHVTRPKSSKGRSRPTVNHLQSMEGVPNQHVSASPRPPSVVAQERGDLQRQRSVKSVDEVTELLKKVPTKPALTLNRYRVLPSIERKQTRDAPFRGLEEKTSRLSLSDNLIVHARRSLCEKHLSSVQAKAASQSHPEMDSTTEVQCTTVSETPSARHQHGLLLAIRSPSGRRFQQHFQPTDTLQTVLAAAEERYDTKYEHGIIETMDVPRTSFSDLTRTLAQSGIQNRSVLCISQSQESYMDSA